MNYDVTVLDIEITDICNAACPMCDRTIVSNTKPNNNPSYINNQQISFKQFKTIIDTNPKVSEFIFCGNFGDPIAAKDFLEIVEYIASLDTKIVIHTNGGLRNEQWWEKLGDILSKNYRNTVVFGIDGLEDTSSFYRRHTNYKKVIANATAFIDNTMARSEWSFIKFKHNEHQIDEAKQVSEQLGFTSFVVNHTSRFAINNVTSFEFYEDGKQYILEPPTSAPKNIPRSAGPIKCVAIANNRVFLSSDGRIWPCCWIETAYRTRYDPSLNKIIDANDLTQLDATKYTLKQITNSDFFKMIEQKWVDMQPRTCYTKCGKDLKNIRQPQ